MERWSDEAPQSPLDEDDEELEGDWELDPNNPSHPDYDLSEAAGYADWEPQPKPWYLRRGVMLVVAVLVITGLMIPVLVRLG
jgi:hypothetical protein